MISSIHNASLTILWQVPCLDFSKRSRNIHPKCPHPIDSFLLRSDDFFWRSWTETCHPLYLTCSIFPFIINVRSTRSPSKLLHLWEEMAKTRRTHPPADGKGCRLERGKRYQLRSKLPIVNTAVPPPRVTKDVLSPLSTASVATRSKKSVAITSSIPTLPPLHDDAPNGLPPPFKSAYREQQGKFQRVNRLHGLIQELDLQNTVGYVVLAIRGLSNHE